MTRPRLPGWFSTLTSPPRRFEGAGKRWITTDPAIALKLLKYADAPARTKLEAIAAEREANLAASRATNADIVIPCPEGCVPMPFQAAGVAFAKNKDGVLLADEMGLGKTVQALLLMNLDMEELGAGAKPRFLIICPASLRINWQRETAKWLTRPLPIHIIEGRAKSEAWDKIIAEGGVVIINFDIVEAHRPDIDRVEWDRLTVDEAHNLRNPEAMRTIAVLGGNDEKARAKLERQRKQRAAKKAREEMLERRFQAA